MKPRVYVETSVVSYLVARPSHYPTNQARQLHAKRLWNAKASFQLLVSDVVIDEAAQGDAALAQLRLDAMRGLVVLQSTDETQYLAELLLSRKALPKQAIADAAHIAVATVHQVQVLASYNFRHLASVFAREKIESTLRQLGYQPPLIATPEAILGHDHGQS